MSTTKRTRAPGRPRNLDPEMAVAKIQPLFHAHGYDAVSVVDVTVVLSIKPPSFYVAFGNKIGLYKQVLDRYVQTKAIPFDNTLHPDKPVSACLTDLLEEAVRRYAADPHTPGCLVLKGTHSNDPQTWEAAWNFYSAAEHKIHDFIAQRHPKEANSPTDYISTTMPGLSGKARCRHSFEHPLASARIASVTVRHQLSRWPSQDKVDKYDGENGSLIRRCLISARIRARGYRCRWYGCNTDWRCRSMACH